MIALVTLLALGSGELLAGRFETGVVVGFTPVSKLTEHFTLEGQAAYHVADWLAVELLGGYAASQHTGLATKVARDFETNMVSTVDDFSDLWQMTAHATLGLRAQTPIGELRVFEVPVGFQVYLALGGGAAWFTRTSIVMCTARVGSSCAAWFQEQRPGPVATAAVGLRVFPSGPHALRLEVRDFTYQDSYYTGINRSAALSGAPPAFTTTASKTGFTNLVQLQVGYSFVFD